MWRIQRRESERRDHESRNAEMRKRFIIVVCSVFELHNHIQYCVFICNVHEFITNIVWKLYQVKFLSIISDQVSHVSYICM